MNVSRPLLALGLLGAGVIPVHAQDAKVFDQTFSIGAWYATGDYGEDRDTKILYTPLGYELNVGKWGFQLLVPHLEVDGLNNVLINIGGVTRAVAGTQETVSSGLGDSIVSVVYRLDPISRHAPFIDLRLGVKIPTADEGKSLGTGETDYSIQVDMSRNVGNTAVFASVGYSFRGRSDIFEGLEDSAFAQLGFSHPLGPRWTAGVFYDFREAASSWSKETHELLPYLSWQLNDHWSVTGLAGSGFTDASPDFSVQGQLRYRW